MARLDTRLSMSVDPAIAVTPAVRLVVTACGRRRIVDAAGHDLDCADCGSVPLVLWAVMNDQAQTADAPCGQEIAVGVDDRLSPSTGLRSVVAVIGPQSRLVPCRQVRHNGLGARWPSCDAGCVPPQLSRPCVRSQSDETAPQRKGPCL